MKQTLSFLTLLLGILTGIAAADPAPARLARHPAPQSLKFPPLAALPHQDTSTPRQYQVNVRSRDLSHLDLSDRLTDLLYADFDSRTRWPSRLPAGFDLERIQALGKNPGLGVRTLHERGLTGRGVGIAIIDLPLLVDHVEYRDRLRHYEELPASRDDAQMHGPAVASIAVGKTVGVAPEADLHYIATTFFGRKYDVIKDYPGRDFTWSAKAVDRVLAWNQALPAERRIRVISMSVGWDYREDGYREMCDAVARARAAGVFVVSSCLRDTYRKEAMTFQGLGREPLSDPDALSSFGPGYWWTKLFYGYGKVNRFGDEDSLLLPMDSRCVASPTGPEDYVFYRHGGWSWAIPYAAGLYAIACQVDPTITPARFWSLAVRTGDALEVEHEGRRLPFRQVVNPARLMEAVGRRE